MFHCGLFLYKMLIQPLPFFTVLRRQLLSGIDMLPSNFRSAEETVVLVLFHQREEVLDIACGPIAA